MMNNHYYLHTITNKPLLMAVIIHWWLFTMNGYQWLTTLRNPWVNELIIMSDCGVNGSWALRMVHGWLAGSATRGYTVLERRGEQIDIPR